MYIVHNTFCKQDDIQTLKISNMVLVRDRIYELLVTRKYYYKENYYGYNGYYGNLFGLLQISQCSDHGNFYMYFIYYNIYLVLIIINHGSV